MASQIGSAAIPTNAIASSFGTDSALTFERRVDRLLMLVDGPVSEYDGGLSSYRIGAVTLAVSIVTLSAILLFAPLSIHHAAEALIGIFK